MFKNTPNKDKQTSNKKGTELSKQSDTFLNTSYI